MGRRILLSTTNVLRLTLALYVELARSAMTLIPKPRARENAPALMRATSVALDVR